jgi:hypothetical protein
MIKICQPYRSFLSSALITLGIASCATEKENVLYQRPEVSESERVIAGSHDEIWRKTVRKFLDDKISIRTLDSDGGFLATEKKQISVADFAKCPGPRAFFRRLDKYADYEVRVSEQEEGSQLVKLRLTVWQEVKNTSSNEKHFEQCNSTGVLEESFFEYLEGVR